MAHHKRKRTTSRSETKRLDNKAYRAAERHALETTGNPGSPRTERWCYRPEPLPLGDQPSNGKRHGRKKPRPKKEKCPANRVHEWYKETVEDKDFYVLHNRCDECATKNIQGPYGGYVYGCWIHGHRIYYVTRRDIATCIHCWERKVLKSERVYGPDEDEMREATWGVYWRRRRNKRLKHRTQDPVSGMTLAVK